MDGTEKIPGTSEFFLLVYVNPRFMTKEERKDLFERLSAIHPAFLSNLEEEIVTPYPAVRQRLRYAGVKVDWEQ